eukprot:TRINITY_DN16309_c0_g1_i3.p1 TRINITY_DN16309_c0_g1~~TRINITY_DN16309_c0_g1_i3.p1  ORF type:complete len:418 (+),score=110.12 TRINITY_DN16309_c0_g1_i3:116-1255(+)
MPVAASIVTGMPTNRTAVAVVKRIRQKLSGTDFHNTHKSIRLTEETNIYASQQPLWSPAQAAKEKAARSSGAAKASGEAAPVADTASTASAAAPSAQQASDTLQKKAMVRDMVDEWKKVRSPYLREFQELCCVQQCSPLPPAGDAESMVGYVAQVVEDAKRALGEAQDSGDIKTAAALDSLLSALPSDLAGVVVHSTAARNGKAPRAPDTPTTAPCTPGNGSANGGSTAYDAESDEKTSAAVKIVTESRDMPHIACSFAASALDMGDVTELDRLVRGNIREIQRLRALGGKDAGQQALELQTSTDAILRAENAATKIQSLFRGIKARKDTRMRILLGEDADQRQEPDAIEVPEQVTKLIELATSHENLAQCYIGWCPFW